jgi:hypothetical protein
MFIAFVAMSFFVSGEPAEEKPFAKDAQMELDKLRRTIPS